MTEIEQVPAWLIKPSRWQPRRAFDEDALWELAQSIDDHGLINPVTVFDEPDADGYTVYELVAGERRTRALLGLALGERYDNHGPEQYVRRLAHVGLQGLNAQEIATLKDAQVMVPAIIKRGMAMEDLHVLAIVENLDRANLNPLEEAHGYQGLIDAYGWSQRELAQYVNKSQGYIAQRLSLLQLNEQAHEALNTRVLGLAHARALASVPEKLQKGMTEAVIRKVDVDGATTRDIEALTKAVARFTDVNRWAINPAQEYTPRERNSLRWIQWALKLWHASSREPDVEPLLQISCLYAHVKDIIRYDSVTEVVKALKAKGRVPSWNHYVEAEGLTCHDCIFSNVERERHPLVSSHCPRPHISLPERIAIPICRNYIGSQDPVMPHADYQMRSQALRLGIDIKRIRRNGFYYVDNIPDYLKLYDAACKAHPYHNSDNESHKTTRLHRIREKLAAFYKFQLYQMDAETRQHFQAHTCEKCRHYIEEWGTPCVFAREPVIQSDEPRAPAMGLLVSQGGTLLTRCELFSFAESALPQLPSSQYDIHVDLFTRTEFYNWMPILWKSKFARHAVWAPLGWLPYQRTIGNESPAWKRNFSALTDYLAEHFNELGRDAGLIQLMDLIVNEGRWRRELNDNKPAPLLNPMSGREEIWCSLPFPLTQVRSWQVRNWPADWARPWEKER
jgi:ParB family chromosome partitioning protein